MSPNQKNAFYQAVIGESLSRSFAYKYLRIGKEQLIEIFVAVMMYGRLRDFK